MECKWKRQRPAVMEESRRGQQFERRTDSEWDFEIYSDQTEIDWYPQSKRSQIFQAFNIKIITNVSTNTARFMCIRYECKIKWWFTEMPSDVELTRYRYNFSLSLSLCVFFSLSLLFFVQGFFSSCRSSFSSFRLPDECHCKFKYLK